MKQTTRFWQVISVLVSLASLSWGVWSFLEKKYQREADAATIIRQAQRIYDLEGRIRAHEAQIKAYQVEIDELTVLSENSLKQAEKHFNQSLLYKAEIDKLKTVLNETPTFDIPDNVKFFLNWTNQ